MRKKKVVIHLSPLQHYCSVRFPLCMTPQSGNHRCSCLVGPFNKPLLSGIWWHFKHPGSCVLLVGSRLCFYPDGNFGRTNGSAGSFLCVVFLGGTSGVEREWFGAGAVGVVVVVAVSAGFAFVSLFICFAKP